MPQIEQERRLEDEIERLRAELAREREKKVRAAAHELSRTQLLETLLENANQGWVAFQPLKNKQGEILDFEYRYINRKAAGILGHNVSELIGKTLLQLFPEQKHGSLLQQYREVLASGNPQEGNFF